MMRAPTLAPLLVIIAASGCVENTAPGNDREASLDAPAKAAEVAAVGAALQNVANGAIYPQIMVTADLAQIPEPEDRCVFRFTRVGMPVFVYGSTRAVIKLNGKLVFLPALGEGTYSDGPVRVTVRPLEDDEQDGQVLTEFVLRLDGAPNELGFRGFSGC